MVFWILASGLALLATLWMGWTFLKGQSLEMNEADGTISVFRDQLDEVERDHAEGLINEDERDAARVEIEARTLQAARQLDTGTTLSHRSVPAVLAIVVLGTLATLLGYATLGNPEMGDLPLAERKTEMLERRAASGDVNSQIALLIEKTSQNPDSFEDWWTLAVSYGAIGDHASSVEAYRKAADLGGDRPGVLSAYAEAMTLANGNKVPQAARVVFEQVLRNGPDARARYYVALAKAQAQDFENALADWAALAADSQPNAPWMPLVRRDIVNMVRFLKLDVAQFLPDATPEEIAKAGGAPVEQSAVARVTELEAALKTDPLNQKAWIELATILAKNGDNDAANAAIAQARTHFAAAPFVLQMLNRTASELGLDLLEKSSGQPGPTEEDIAAAANMTKSEQDDMIAGMVAGLAAKLEAEPDNLEGWIMLVRSYMVLGKTDKAAKALEDARDALQGNAAMLKELETNTSGLLE